jgi:hypothetical protein
MIRARLGTENDCAGETNSNLPETETGLPEEREELMPGPGPMKRVYKEKIMKRPTTY